MKFRDGALVLEVLKYDVRTLPLKLAPRESDREAVEFDL